MMRANREERVLGWILLGVVVGGILFAGFGMTVYLITSRR